MISPARRAALGTALTVAVVLLAAVNAVKYGIVSEAFFSAHEKTIDGVGKILATLALVSGAIASYFRFFKGRTFAPRAELSIAVSVIAATDVQHLHVIDVRLKNIGPVPLWDPRIRMRIQTHGPTPAEPIEIKGWRLERTEGGEEDVCVVDSQEDALYHAERMVSVREWAVRYEAAVTTTDGDSWFGMTTVANKVGRPDSGG